MSAKDYPTHQVNMNALGLGIDILDLRRVRQGLDKGDSLLQAWLSSRELALIGAGVRSEKTIGLIIAAKEAAAKALGTGFSGNVSWTDIEIFPEEMQATVVILSGGALRAAEAQGVKRIFVSSSVTPRFAVVTALAVG